MTDQMMWAVVLGVNVLVQLIMGLVVIQSSVRSRQRTPPLAEELAKEYVTKPELASFRCEWQRICSTTHARMDDTVGKLFDLNRESERRLGEWQRAVAAQLGRIENSVQSTRRNHGEHAGE